MARFEKPHSSPEPRYTRLARWLVNPGEGLTARVLHAATWAFALSLSLRLLNLTRTVVLGNLLSPADFGVAAIAVLVVGLVETTSEAGFQQALIQRKGDIRAHLNTVWTMQVIRGALLSGTLALAAPFVGRFYDTPSVVPMIWALSAGVFVREFRNIGVLYFEKDLRFHRDFAYRFTPQLANVLFAIVFAIVYPSPWALIVGLLVWRLSDLVLSYLIHDFRPRFRFDRVYAADVFRFGRWFLLSSILVYMLLNLDDLVVGKVVGVTALGWYTMAFSISQLATTEVTKTVSRVSFPTFALLQDRLTELHMAYTRTLAFVALLSFPATAGLWFVGPQAVELFLGSKWLPMIGALNVLLIWGLIRSLLATTGPLFQGIGKPYVNTAIQAAQAGLLVVLIYPLTTTWGIVGAAWATVLAALAPDSYAIAKAIRTVGGNVRDVLYSIGFPILNTMLMSAALLMLRAMWRPEPSLGWVFLTVGVGVLTYTVSVVVTRRFLGYLPEGLLPKLSS